MLSLGTASKSSDSLTGRLSIFALPSNLALAATGAAVHPMIRPNTSACPPTGLMVENARKLSAGRRGSLDRVAGERKSCEVEAVAVALALLGARRSGLDFGLRRRKLEKRVED